MAKAKEEKTEDPAKEPGTALAEKLSDEEMDDMYGSSAPDQSTPLSFNHVKIIRDTAQFEIADGEYEKTIVGHVLYKHRASQYFVGKYDPSDPTPPLCFSIDGVTPCGGDDVQCDTVCKACKHDAYGTGTDSKGEPTKGKACKNSIRFLFLEEGKMLPITLTAPPTSLGAKGYLQKWLNSVPDAVAEAHKALKITNRKGEPIVDFLWARVELALEKKVTPGGEVSLLKVKTLDVLVPDTDENKILCRSLHNARKTYTQVYMDELATFMTNDSDSAQGSDPVVSEENAGGDYEDDDEVLV